MKYISICSGIEAASVAWHGLGWTPIAFSEIEAFPCAVLAHHWPDVPNLGDMTKFAEWPEELLAECDILVGGPPCQAFSVAGLRRSLDDARGNITLAYVRLLTHIDEVRKRHGRPPAIAVYENVPGLLSTKDNAFGCLVGALAGCDEAVETESGKWPKAGYVCGETRRVGYRILDAQYFGVAQRRRRVFLVAVPCELVERVGERVCPSEILSLRESLLGNPPTRSQQGQDAARSSADSTGGRLQPCVEAVEEQPVFIDRAMFNQGQNAQYDPQVTQDGVASSMVARGPAAVVWSASDQANAERVVEATGTLNCNRGQRGGWIGPVAVPDPAYALSAGNQSKGGVFGSGRDSQDTFVVAFKPGQSEAAGGTFATDEYAPTLQSQNNGSTAVPAVAFTAKDYGGQIAVAFEPGYFTRGKAGKPDTIAPAVLADADKGDQDTVVCATGPITHSLTTRSACEEDGTGRGNPIVPCFGVDTYNQTMGDTSIPLRVGNAKDSLPAVMVPSIGFNWQNGGGYGKANDGLGITEEGTGPLQRCNTPAVQSQMQVRRLTPTECEYLQGFPAGHTNVIYRKKPAADGPRYRALGNSMAVPCMLWLGYRILKATHGDNECPQP